MRSKAMATAEEIYRFWFYVQRSIRYHDSRRKFFEGLHLGGTGLGIMLSTSAFLTLVAPFGTSPALYLTALLTLVSVLGPVAHPAERACVHLDLKRQFSELERSILLAGMSRSRLHTLQARLSRIEEGEPPIKHVLDAMCHNELARAEGHDASEFVSIGFLQRLLAQFVDFGAHTLSKGTRAEVGVPPEQPPDRPAAMGE